MSCAISCISADIKAEKHDSFWEAICGSTGIARVSSPVDSFFALPA